MGVRSADEEGEGGAGVTHASRVTGSENGCSRNASRRSYRAADSWGPAFVSRSRPARSTTTVTMMCGGGEMVLCRSRSECWVRVRGMSACPVHNGRQGARCCSGRFLESRFVEATRWGEMRRFCCPSSWMKLRPDQLYSLTPRYQPFVSMQSQASNRTSQTECVYNFFVCV